MFSFANPVMCRNCGNEMRLDSIEPMHRTTRGEFHCDCGHVFGFDMPRRNMSAKARRQRMISRLNPAA